MLLPAVRRAAAGYPMPSFRHEITAVPSRAPSRRGRCRGATVGCAVVVPALAGLEDDDAGPVDALLAALLDEARDGPERVPAEREDPALAVADRDETAGPEHGRRPRGLVGPHLAAESEEALAADGEERRVEVREARRDVDQLGKVARVARDVDARGVRLEDVAVLRDAVAGRDGGHHEAADRGGVPPSEVGHAAEPEGFQARVELGRRDRFGHAPRERTERLRVEA